MNIFDLFYLKNRNKSLFINQNLNISKLDIDKTVLVNFGLSKEEDAIYSYKKDTNFIKKYNLTKNNLFDLNKKMYNFKKIFILNSFLHYENIFNNKDNNKDNNIQIKDIFIDEFSNIDDKAILIFKKSQNAFVSPGFYKWLSFNIKEVNTYIIAGFSFIDDIIPFVISLNSYYKEWDIPCNIIIDYNSVLNTSGLNKNSLPKIYNPIFIDFLSLNNIKFIDSIS